MPVGCGSIVDFVCEVEQTVSAEQVNQAIHDSIKADKLEGIVITDAPTFKRQWKYRVCQQTQAHQRQRQYGEVVNLYDNETVTQAINRFVVLFAI